jgi:hypothetical protein
VDMRSARKEIGRASRSALKGIGQTASRDRASRTAQGGPGQDSLESRQGSAEGREDFQSRAARVASKGPANPAARGRAVRGLVAQDAAAQGPVADLAKDGRAGDSFPLRHTMTSRTAPWRGPFRLA